MNNCVLKIEADGRLNWFTLDESGHVLHCQEYNDFASLPRDAKHWVVLIPGQDVYVETITLPKASRNTLNQALPFLLEDKLLDPIENLYLVTTKIAASANYLVAAINRGKFIELYEQLKQNNLQPNAILPDFFAYPVKNGVWNLQLDDTHAIVRLDEYNGFSVAKANLSLALECASQTHKCVQFPRDQAAPAIFDLKIFSEKPIINFLQGEFRLQKKNNKKSLWPLARVLAAALFLIVVGGKLLQWSVYQHQYNQQRTQISTAVQALLPGASTSDDPKLLLLHELQRLTVEPGHDTFIKLLGSVGTILQRFPSVELQTLHYTDDVLTLKIKAHKLADFENFFQALAKSPFKIKQNQVSVNNNTVLGEIKVSQS